MSGRFAVIPMAWLEDDRIEPSHIALLCCLSGHANREGYAYPSQARMASICGRSKGWVSQTISDLEKWGYLRVEGRENRGRSVGYFLLMDRFETVQPAEHPIPTVQPAKHTVQPAKHTVQPAKHEQYNITTDKNSSVYSHDFEAFWEAYPRRIAKRAAWRAWQAALKRNHDDAEFIIAGARAYAATSPPERYTKHPATWLNADGWLDDYSTTTSTVWDKLEAHYEQPRTAGPLAIGCIPKD